MSLKIRNDIFIGGIQMSPDPNMNLPVKTGDDFIGEFETMDISALKNKDYMVAVSSGDRNGVKFLCSTLSGPYSFEEMCEQVGTMWREHQHHAKVILCKKDMAAKQNLLDQNTVDYIEANFQDIITEAMLDGVFDEDKEYTCRAGINEDQSGENPLAPENKPEVAIEEEDDSL
jgi:hypothetical protein